MPDRKGAPPRAASVTAPASVVFENDRLVAIAKPPGVSLATPRSSPGAAVERLVAALPAAEREAAGLDPTGLRLVHRLDLSTSGLVLLARDDDAHRTLAALFAGRRVEKTYLALVWGRPRPPAGRIDAPLGPDPGDRRRMRVDPGGRPSATRYRIVEALPHASLVALEPETGRTHQIRVHLSHRGHPIVGDDLYGGPRHRGVRDARLRRALEAPRTLLHAARLHLPWGGPFGELILEAPLPADFLACLAPLRQSPNRTGE